jgi:serine protease Do
MMKRLGKVSVAAVAMIAALVTSAAAQESRQNATVKAVQKVKPSVVSIRVPNPVAKDGKKELIGTGLIIDERGYIVTNRHIVVGIETRIKVRLLDATELTAKVIFSDAGTDLAILRIDAGKKLPAQILAPAGDLKEGEDVIAVGHPFGYSYTVSKGIISALGRDIPLPSGYILKGLIQIDASINPGNSGGPLLNINGEVIGINVALREGAQGIAFAINSETVKRLLSEHLSALKIAGVTHGLKCQDKTLAETGPRQLVVVAAVDAQTPAASAGVKVGDEILCVAHWPVANRFDVERAMWDAKPGQQVVLKVRRQGRELNLTLTLASAPGPNFSSAPAKQIK